MVSLMILCGKFAFLLFVLQTDAKLDDKEHEGQEVLRVRAYSSSFFTLGINIRLSFPLSLALHCFPFAFFYHVCACP